MRINLFKGPLDLFPVIKLFSYLNCFHSPPLKDVFSSPNYFFYAIVTRRVGRCVGVAESQFIYSLFNYFRMMQGEIIHLEQHIIKWNFVPELLKEN